MSEDVPPPPQVRIIDEDGRAPAYVDWFIEAGQGDGMVFLSLGTYDPTLVSDGKDVFARAYSACKLRMTVPMAKRLSELLSGIVKDAEREAAAPKGDSE